MASQSCSDAFAARGSRLIIRPINYFWLRKCVRMIFLWQKVCSFKLGVALGIHKSSDNYPRIIPYHRELIVYRERQVGGRLKGELTAVGLIAAVPTVRLPITDPHEGDAALVLAHDLVWLACDPRAVQLVGSVCTVVLAVAFVCLRNAQAVPTLEVWWSASIHGTGRCKRQKRSRCQSVILTSSFFIEYDCSQLSLKHNYASCLLALQPPL